MTDISTLKPGLLVSVKTGIDGNVQYLRNEIESDHVTARGTREAEWQTRRVISDPAEYETGQKVRSKALSLIRSVCIKSSFGLLCPEAKQADLNQRVIEARAMVSAFNRQATLTGVKLYVLIGRVASDDVEAVRAIKSEIRDLIKSMQDGIKNNDATAIREAATRAKGVGRMLSEEAQKRVQDAVDMARAAAKVIVKTGEEAAVEIDAATIRKLAKARTSFLDIDEDADAPAAVISARSAKAVTLDIDEGAATAAPAPVKVRIERYRPNSNL